VIPPNVREKINKYLGSESKPYLISFYDGTEDYGCEYWNLPPQKEQDKPIHVQYQELTTKLVNLMQENRNDPQIETLVKKANELLVGIPVTKKSGASLVSINDFLLLDKLKGIRKEWWDLKSNLEDSRVCIFQGYRSIEAQTTEIADMLIAMPNRDQFEFLRMNSTRGNNYPISTEQIIKSLQRIDREFGIFIIFAREDFLEFIFRKPIKSKDRNRIRQRLHRLCPDAEELTESIKVGIVSFWWD
jgi:hypothetical protein